MGTQKFTISFVRGTQYIECHTCNMRSFNPNDIKHKYCGNCNVFHETGKERTLEDCARLATEESSRVGIDVFG